MTTAALERKLKADAPPPSYRKFDLLNSPEFAETVAEVQRLEYLHGYPTKSALEEKIKSLKSDIEAMLTASEVDKVEYEDGWLIKIGNGRVADKLSVTRLVELGVSVDIIAEATEEGKPYTFAQLVAPKAAKGGE